jgi:hypothetical protein
MSEARDLLETELRQQKIKISRLERRSVLGSSLKLERARERRLAAELAELLREESLPKLPQLDEPILIDGQAV